jgi:hypothetical protein
MLAGGDGGFSDFRIVPDRLHQGMLNALVLMRLVTSAAFAADAAVTFAGRRVISTAPGDRFYTGNSQGGIMGAVYMGASTDVTRGVLGVGGAPYSLLLPRSSDFSELFDVLHVRYPRSIDIMAIFALMQGLWDSMDGAGWAAYIAAPVDARTPAHRIVSHYGLGDHQVTWLGAHAVARTAGAAIFASNVREGNESLAYFDSVPDDAVLTQGSLTMGFDFGFPVCVGGRGAGPALAGCANEWTGRLTRARPPPPPNRNPFINVPPATGPDAHECPRRSLAAQAQMARFFKTGEIVNTCGGPCVLNGCPSG